MKKLLVLLSAIFLANINLKASHLVGGEISWTCIGSSYQFEMTVFRDCTGIDWTFENETIQILGFPSPGISAITVKPNQSIGQNGVVDTSPECADQSLEFSCAAEDPGTIQAFYYKSDPVTLTGTPPSSGWRFYWEAPCCRTNPQNVANLQTQAGSSRMLLRAIMYPDAQNNPVTDCDGDIADPRDDRRSPKFRALPTTLISRGYEFTYNHTAVDEDLDSLVYAWDYSYDAPVNNPFRVPFKNRYAFDNVTDDQTFDSRNIPATLEPTTGVVNLKVYSGNGAQKYFTITRVDSWRDGRVIASVFREFPFVFFNPVPLQTGLPNNPPEVFLDGVNSLATEATIVAGQKVNVAINVIDNDATGVGIGVQTITLTPDGIAFNNPIGGINNPNSCYAAFNSCAILQNQSTFFNNGVPQLQGLGGIGTEFVWATNCEHVNVTTGVPGTNEGIYNFVMRVQDDHCPIPALNYPTITVKVRDPFPLDEPIMKGASVGLDGKVTYSWVPPLDSATTFDKYKVQLASPNNGLQPTFFPNNYVNPNLRKYQERQTNQTYPIFNPQDDILQPKRPLDWYVRMTTESGCDKDVPSDPSQSVRVMELETSPSGQLPDPIRSEALLQWNAPKAPNSDTKDHFLYESKTWYYIYENDSIAVGGVADPNNWYLRGRTDQLSFNVQSNTCSGPIGFRIEARDTVRTYKQGTAPRQDSVVELRFSTFSLVDTILMVTRGFIPPPKLDTIAKLANGDVFLKINPDRGTIGRFRILRPSDSSLITAFDSNIDSVLITGADANLPAYLIQGIDKCDVTRSIFSEFPYQINGPNVVLNAADECDQKIDASWFAPTGFPNGVSSYIVEYSTVSNQGPFISNGRVNTTSDQIENLEPGKTYYVRVIAYDNEGAVNISGISAINTPSSFRNYSIVPPPVLRTTYVEDDGSITIGFADSLGAGITPAQKVNLERKNPGDPFIELEYRFDGGAWTRDNAASNLFAELDQSTTTQAAEIDAQNGQYDFRVRVLSGCEGDEPSDWSNTISSIDVDAVARALDSLKRGDIEWNATGVDYGNSTYTLYRAEGTPVYAPGNLRVQAERTFEDALPDACGVTMTYYVTISDPLTGNVSRSNMDDAFYDDFFPPEPQVLDFLTIDPIHGLVTPHWTEKPSTDIDSLLFNRYEGLNSGIPSFSPFGRVIWNAQFYPGRPEFNVEIPRTIFTVFDSTVTIAAQSIDQCSKRSEIDNLHTTIDVEVEWNQCDSVMEISWNPYDYFNFGADTNIMYVVKRFEQITPNPIFNPAANRFLPIPIVVDTVINDTNASFKVIDGNRNYFFFVDAIATRDNGSLMVSRSTFDSDSAFYEDEPLYGYLQYATVLEDNSVELQMYKDTVVPTGAYTIYRGQEKEMMNPIFRQDADTIFKDTSFQFNDFNVDVNTVSYFYKIITENQCGGSVDTSNFASTIHLTVDPDNEALTNTLRWNEYQEWDSTVAYYNVYRGVNGEPATELRQVVPPAEVGDMNVFVDDVYDDLFARGDFSYVVEAVQGPVSIAATDSLPNNLESATSRSNTVSVVQKPLFYVPNAFAPDGVNKVFGPQGQFFDFSFYEMIIYNRWGEQVFETRDIAKGWDGTVNGKDPQIGSYVYMIRFKDAEGEEHRRKGTVTIIK